MPSNPMVRSNGARLAYWFGRRFLGSKLVDDSSITLNKSLHQKNAREFGSDICNSSRFLGKSENGNQRNGVWFGVSHCGLDSKRLFHGTGSTYMAARDDNDMLGVSRNASASENEKADCELGLSGLNRGAGQLRNGMQSLDIEQGKYVEQIDLLLKTLKGSEHNELMYQPSPKRLMQELLSGLNRGAGQLRNGMQTLDIEQRKYSEQIDLLLRILKGHKELMHMKRSRPKKSIIAWCCIGFSVAAGVVTANFRK